MDPTRDEIRAWLAAVLERTGETPTSLARKAGLAQSTLTRFMNRDDGHLLGLRSITKIAHASGIAPPGMPSQAHASSSKVGGTSPRGLADTEAIPFKMGNSSGTPLLRALSALMSDRNAADVWEMKSLALVCAGFLPGDLMLVDLNAVARSGDAVCAQIYQWSAGKADTVFRIFEPPYLVAAAFDPALRKPLIVDNDRVIIKGVVTETLRLRR